MSKKENTTGTTMATEIIRDMKRRETKQSESFLEF